MRPDVPQKWPGGQARHSVAMERNILVTERDSWRSSGGESCFLGLPFHGSSPRLPGALSACEGLGKCGSPLPKDRHLGTGPFILILNPNSGCLGPQTPWVCQLQPEHPTALQPLSPQLSPCSGESSFGDWEVPKVGRWGSALECDTGKRAASWWLCCMTCLPAPAAHIARPVLASSLPVPYCWSGHRCPHRPGGILALEAHIPQDGGCW